MIRGAVISLALVLAAAVGGFAIYTFGYRHQGSSLPSAEQVKVASIIAPGTESGSSWYVDGIRRLSPGHYLVRWGNTDHPSVRACSVVHINLAKWKMLSAVQAPCGRS